MTFLIQRLVIWCPLRPFKLHEYIHRDFDRDVKLFLHLNVGEKSFDIYKLQINATTNKLGMLKSSIPVKYAGKVILITCESVPHAQLV